jgi:hypothetical protein
MTTKLKPTRAKGKETTPAVALAGFSLKDDQLLTTGEAATLVGLSQKSMRQMRCDRTGPRCLKVGSSKQARIFYRRSDLERWVVARVVTVGGQS